MEKQIIGYRCVDNVEYNNDFTVGKIYQLRDGVSLKNSYAFIDDSGEPNGWGYNNELHFEPVYAVVLDNHQNQNLTSEAHF